MKPKFLVTISLISLIACGQPKVETSNEISANTCENNEVAAINRDFFDRFEKKGTNSAIDFLFKKSDELDPSIIKAKLDTAAAVFGQYTGVEKITEKGISNALILTSFLVKYEKQPLRFTIIYYKPKNDWILYKFQIDEATLSELEGSAKLFMFK